MSARLTPTEVSAGWWNVNPATMTTKAGRILLVLSERRGFPAWSQPDER